MNPEDVIIPELLEEGTEEEIKDRVMDMCQQIHDLDPHLIALAVTFQQDQSQANLDAFLALDAKRREIDDVFCLQLAVMRNLGIQREDC